MRKEKQHYSKEEKELAIYNTTGLSKEDSKTIAREIDCLTFFQLKELAKAISIISKGK